MTRAALATTPRSPAPGGTRPRAPIHARRSDGRHSLCLRLRGRSSDTRSHPGNSAQPRKNEETRALARAVPEPGRARGTRPATPALGSTCSQRPAQGLSPAPQGRHPTAPQRAIVTQACPLPGASRQSRPGPAGERMAPPPPSCVASAGHMLSGDREALRIPFADSGDKVPSEGDTLAKCGIPPDCPEQASAREKWLCNLLGPKTHRSRSTLGLPLTVPKRHALDPRSRGQGRGQPSSRVHTPRASPWTRAATVGSVVPVGAYGAKVTRDSQTGLLWLNTGRVPGPPDHEPYFHGPRRAARHTATNGGLPVAPAAPRKYTNHHPGWWLPTSL